MQKPQIAGYEILEKIAEGGMATVWKARQISLDRLVALKVLNAGLVKGESDLERFRLEARSAAHVRHSGLCQIYDAGETEGSVYYVMEYVAGFSVGQLLNRKGDLPEKQALMIVNGVATVLQAVWDKHKLIHCDIKPDNVLIDQDGAIRITDLGVARIIGSMAQQVDADYVVGTPNYISPEQVQGVEDLDCRTDIYGLGATLYHMLTGLMPFADKEGEGAMEGQISGNVADPQVLNPAVSNSAAGLVEKMMVKDRTARYPDWSALLKDLEEVRAGRLPRGELVPRGQSTVSRTEERETAMLDEIRSMKPRTVTSKPMTAGGRPQAGSAGPGQRRRRAAASAGPTVKPRLATPPLAGSAAEGKYPVAWGRMYSLILLVGVAYAATYFYFNQPATSPEPALDEVTEAPVVVEGPAPVASRPRAEATRPVATAPVPARPAATEVSRGTPTRPDPAVGTTAAAEWDHPDYREAMRLLRDADASFQRFLSNRDQSLLDPVEPACRKAIGLLEGVRADAPAEAVVGERIRQSYQLIHNARQARVMAR